MQSIWRKTTHVSERRELQGNISVQNVVIGAGMAGLLTAYFLWKKGLIGICQSGAPTWDAI